MVKFPTCPTLNVEVPPIVKPVVLADNDRLTASRQFHRRELILIVLLIRWFQGGRDVVVARNTFDGYVASQLAPSICQLKHA